MYSSANRDQRQTSPPSRKQLYQNRPQRKQRPSSEYDDYAYSQESPIGIQDASRRYQNFNEYGRDDSYARRDCSATNSKTYDQTYHQSYSRSYASDHFGQGGTTNGRGNGRDRRQSHSGMNDYEHQNPRDRFSRSDNNCHQMESFYAKSGRQQTEHHNHMPNYSAYEHGSNTRQDYSRNEGRRQRYDDDDYDYVDKYASKQQQSSKRSNHSNRSNQSNCANRSNCVVPRGVPKCSNKSSKVGRNWKGKEGNRKLDAKVFGLSMELIEHVSKGRVDMAKQKIKQGAKADFADYDKRTALHLAASEGHADVVRLLLEHGANPNVQDRWGSRPMDDAVKNKHKEICDILRKYCEGDEDTLEKEHHDGLELLEYCAQGLEDLVRSKIKAGTASMFADYDKRTGLHLACSEGHAKIVEILLQNGACCNAKDRFGRSAIDDAMKNGFMEVLEVFHKRGIKMGEHLFEQSCTETFQRNMFLIEVAAIGKIGRVQKLLLEGADVKFGDYDMRTALHLACAEGHVNAVRMLLNAGANVAAEDRWGATPLEEALKNKHEAVIEFLEREVMTKKVGTWSGMSSSGGSKNG